MSRPAGLWPLPFRLRRATLRHVPHHRLLLLPRLPLGLHWPQAVHGHRATAWARRELQARVPRPSLRRNRRPAAEPTPPRPPALSTYGLAALARQARLRFQPAPETLAV